MERPHKFDGPDNSLSGWPKATGSTQLSNITRTRLLPVRRSAPGQQVVRAIEACPIGKFPFEALEGPAPSGPRLNETRLAHHKGPRPGPDGAGPSRKALP